MYRCAIFVATLLLPLSVLAQVRVTGCGELGNGYGPFDYRTEFGEPKRLVEGAHFKPEIEALISGQTSDRTAGGDIDYTLRAFPNHHRALIATMRLSEKEKTDKPAGMRYPVECWLERAIRYKPDDTIARMIYVTYLLKKGRTTDATGQLEVATSYASDDSFAHYNIGLLYFDLKNYGRSLEQAHKAMELGFSRAALREQLQAAGKWHDPTPRPNRPAMKGDASGVSEEAESK